MPLFPNPSTPLSTCPARLTELRLSRWEVLEHWPATLERHDDGLLLTTDTEQWGYSAQYAEEHLFENSNWGWLCIEGQLLEGILSAGWWTEEGEKEARCDKPGAFSLYIPLPEVSDTPIVLRNASDKGATQALLQRVTRVDQRVHDRLTPILEESQQRLASTGVQHQVLPLLSEEECQHWKEKVLSFREQWTQRGDAPFYTLGLCSYIDMYTRPEVYRAEAQANNDFLLQHFGGLLLLLQTALTQSLVAPVEFCEDLAWPGFHIFEMDETFEIEHARRHYDRQYVHHSWPEGADFERPLSFTLCLDLPASGAGLRLWSIHLEDTNQQKPLLTAEEFTCLQELQPFQEESYSTGTLVHHSGHQLHQIGPFQGDAEKGEMRLTMQGHGIQVNGTWWLYW